MDRHGTRLWNNVHTCNDLPHFVWPKSNIFECTSMLLLRYSVRFQSQQISSKFHQLQGEHAWLLVARRTLFCFSCCSDTNCPLPMPRRQPTPRLCNLRPTGQATTRLPFLPNSHNRERVVRDSHYLYTCTTKYSGPFWQLSPTSVSGQHLITNEVFSSLNTHATEC